MKCQIAFVIVWLLLWCGSVLSHELEIMTEEFAPYGFYENGTLSGLTVDIVQEMLDSLQYAHRIKVYPWARAFTDIKNKQGKVLFPMARTKDREKRFWWVGPLHSDSVYFYKRRGSAVHITTLDDAKKLHTILITRNFPQQTILEEQGFRNLHFTTKPEQDLRMLNADRGDLIVMGTAVIGELSKKVGIPVTTFEKTDVLLFQTDLYIAFSKDIPKEEVARWQQVLDALKLSGKYKDILNRYIR